MIGDLEKGFGDSPDAAAETIRQAGASGKTLTQVERHTLHGKMRFTRCIALCDLDAVEAVVTNDAAPDSIVEIEHETFAGFAADVSMAPTAGARSPGSRGTSRSIKVRSELAVFILAV